MVVSVGLERVIEVVHHIDIDQAQVERKNISEGNLDEYNNILIKTMLQAKNKKHFKFQSETTEINTLLKRIIGQSSEEDKESITNAIANRLLREEISSQEKISNLTNLQKGSLVQSYSRSNHCEYYLITKVEHEKFLNTDDLVNQIGLPYKKRTLKSCLITINHEKEITDIIVSDSNNRISTYWYKSFLELVELQSDEKNTQTAFSAIDSILTRSVKQKSLVDHSLLRNNLIGYFRTNDIYNHEQMIQQVFGNYQVENPTDVNIELIKGKVEQLSNRDQFDSMFNIKDKVIKARMKKKIKVNDKIQLIINGHIEHLKSIIYSEEKPNGDQYLYIKTDDKETFNMFKYNDEC